MKRVALVFAAGLAACSYQPTPQSDTFQYSLVQTEHTKNLAEKQAPFDLGCETEELVFKDLGASTIGVRGCGQKATYKYAGEAGWVLNATQAESE